MLAQEAVRIGHVRMVVFSFDAQGEVMRGLPHQDRSGGLPCRVEALLVRENPLKETTPQLGQRLAQAAVTNE